MTVRVVAFARIREILGSGTLERIVDDATTVGAVWDALASEHPPLATLRDSTRFARNGAFVNAAQTLREGDELALLPPYGGG